MPRRSCRGHLPLTDSDRGAAHRNGTAFSAVAPSERSAFAAHRSNIRECGSHFRFQPIRSALHSSVTSLLHTAPVSDLFGSRIRRCITACRSDGTRVRTTSVIRSRVSDTRSFGKSDCIPLPCAHGAASSQHSGSRTSDRRLPCAPCRLSDDRAGTRRTSRSDV
jgi:hypothetical protein